MSANFRSFALLVLGLCLAGCGGGGGSKIGATSSTTPALTGNGTSGTAATTPTAADAASQTYAPTPSPAGSGGPDGSVVVPGTPDPSLPVTVATPGAPSPATPPTGPVVTPAIPAGQVIAPVTGAVNLPALAPAARVSPPDYAAPAPLSAAAQGDENVIRAMLEGDVLIATVTGTATSGTSSEAVTGRVTTATYTDLMPPVWGTQAMRVVTQWDLVGESSGPVTIVRNEYREQDAAGIVYDLGWSDATTNARLTSTSAAPMLYPSPMGFGQIYYYTARYADGSTRNVSWTVVGQAVVDGRLTYKIELMTIGSDFSSSEQCWFLPSIGYPVKWTATIRQGSALYRLTATLLWRDYGAYLPPP